MMQSHLKIEDWSAIATDNRFVELRRRKGKRLWALAIFSIVYYFLLPIGAAYFPELFRIKVWGPVNIGLLFALSEFGIAWIVAYIYNKMATRSFDPLADEIAAKYAAM